MSRFGRSAGPRGPAKARAGSGTAPWTARHGGEPGARAGVDESFTPGLAMTSHFAAAAIDGSALSAELIESAAALEALRPEWEALWARCPGATPFQWPAWLIAWWRHFAPGALFSVAVRRAGRLVALAPFYVETGAQGRRVLGIGISLSDYLDVLIDPACGEAGSAILARLAAEGARWESCGVPGGVLRDPRVERFQRDAAPELLRAGMLRLYALRIDGHIVGAYYGLAHGARAYAYLGGFDPDYAFESPGTILIGHAIEEAVREGAREFHFLRGPESYKYEWGAVDRWNRRRSFRRVVAYA